MGISITHKTHSPGSPPVCLFHDQRDPVCHAFTDEDLLAWNNATFWKPGEVEMDEDERGRNIPRCRSRVRGEGVLASDNEGQACKCGQMRLKEMETVECVENRRPRRRLRSEVGIESW